MMKILTLLFLMSLGHASFAQKSMFVRVYDLSGKKIHKGRVFKVTDSTLQLVGKTMPVTIPVQSVGFIKTKRSAGNNVLVGSIIGVSSIAILGAASAEPDAEWFGYSAGEGAAGGAIVGLPIGAAIGGLTTAFKNSKTYLINGDLGKWKMFELMITGKRFE
jgi:hypothetical protein